VKTILQRVVASVAASHIPVTLKIRTGWDTAQRNAVTIGRIAEDAGIQSLVIHGRTRACRFNGSAEYDSIAEVKAKLGISVIANGDIVSPEQALAVLKHTGADGIMVGRGAQGSPWLIQQINQAIAGETIVEPSNTEKRQQIIWHITALQQFYGDYLGLRIARKHAGWYFDKLGLSALKKAFNSVDSCEQQLTYLHQLPLLE
jgi:tRNA-dihydrouridine synthase B